MNACSKPTRKRSKELGEEGEKTCNDTHHDTAADWLTVMTGKLESRLKLKTHELRASGILL